MMQFRRTTAGALGAAAALVALGGGAAHAQGGDMTAGKPVRVKIGYFLPYDTDTKDALGTHFLSFGLGYDWKHFNSFLPGVVEVYGDFFNRPKNTIDFGRVQAEVWSVGLATRFNLSPNKDRGFLPYAGAGLGISSAFAKQTDPEGDSQSKTRTTIGGKFLVGAQLKNGLFGEWEYNFLPHPSVFGSDVALSGWQLRLGYAFNIPGLHLWRHK